MRKSLFILIALAAGVTYFAVGTGDGQPQKPASDSKPSGDSDEQTIRKMVAAFAEAFNKGDLSAIGGAWAEDAEYIDEAGKEIKGREAIVAMFKKAASELKGGKIELKVTSVRILKGDVALQDGVSTQTAADGTIDEGRFTAVWFKSDGKWMIRSARDLPSDAAAAAGHDPALKELQWLVGEWEAEKGAVTVSSKWGLGKAFLMQEYKVKEGEGELQVMQLIGFDPLTGQLKSWTFDSRGGYGEALWKREGHSWVGQTAGVLPGGQTGTAVNVIRYVDDKSMQFQSRDREVGGQPLPNAEVKLTRKSAQ
jgi:uncharacterized protein (TIGR02246 family)